MAKTKNQAASVVGRVRPPDIAVRFGSVGRDVPLRLAQVACYLIAAHNRFMRYHGMVIRPPSEANSYILQVSYGLSLIHI